MGSPHVENILSKILKGVESYHKVINEAEQDINDKEKVIVPKMTAVFKDLLPQLTNLGNMVESLTKVVKDLSKHACEDTQDAVANTKINMDAIDEAEQRSLMGSLMITIPCQDLQKDIGIADGRAYDDLNVTDLTT